MRAIADELNEKKVATSTRTSQSGKSGLCSGRDSPTMRLFALGLAVLPAAL
jgi:hypothetical protein